MLLNRNKLLLAGGGFVLILVLLALLRPNSSAHKSPDRKTKETADESQSARVRAGNWRSSSKRVPADISRKESITTAPLDDKSSSRPLVGFFIDDYRAWTKIPDGYFADGVVFRNGGLGPVDRGDPSEVVTGIFQSPPLPLWQPSYSAPAASPAKLPLDCSLHAEVAFSRDGKSWGPWLLAGRHQAPDGTQAVPLEQPQWNGMRPSERTTGADEASSGPKIRYRLTLTGSSGHYPILRDFRIWHNTLAFPQDR